MIDQVFRDDKLVRFARTPTKLICNIKLQEPMICKKQDHIMIRDPDSDTTFGTGKIIKYKAHNLAETSFTYKKKLKDDYEKSKLHK